MPVLSSPGVESLIVQHLRQPLSRLLPQLRRLRKLNEVLAMRQIVLQEPLVHSQRSLHQHPLLAHEFQIHFLNPIVLRHRKSAQRPIKGPTGAGQKLLLRQNIQVHNPHPRHLVHRHQRTLEGVVQDLIAGMLQRQPAHAIHLLLQVRVPDLKTPWQRPHRPLKRDHRDHPSRTLTLRGGAKMSERRRVEEEKRLGKSRRGPGSGRRVDGGGPGPGRTRFRAGRRHRLSQEPLIPRGPSRCFPREHQVGGRLYF